MKRFAGSLFALALLLSTGPMLAEESFRYETGPKELEESAGWGVDLDTGKVAVDAGLIYFFDPTNSTLVINPNLSDDAIEELKAVVQSDGSWLIEGKTYYPVIGELAIDSGQEPEELFAEAALPRVAYERVNIVTEIAEGALKSRIFRKCKNCTDFPCPVDGVCDGNWLYSNLPSPARPGECKFAFFRKCKQRYEPVCDITVFECLDCLGDVIGEGVLLWWSCYDC